MKKSPKACFCSGDVQIEMCELQSAFNAQMLTYSIHQLKYK